MNRRNRLLASLVLATLTTPTTAALPAAKAVTPSAIMAAAPPSDWTALDPRDLLVIDLANGAHVVIALADAFAPVHVANIRRLAHAHWYDGLAIERVQDDYVTQWGDPDGKKPPPADFVRTPPAEYDRPSAGLPFKPLPYHDTYAPAVGVVSAFPVAEQGSSAWLTHCYAMVGVGRDLNPDTGSGAELYAVIGHPPGLWIGISHWWAGWSAAWRPCPACPGAKASWASTPPPPSACPSARSVSAPSCRHGGSSTWSCYAQGARLTPPGCTPRLTVRTTSSCSQPWRSIYAACFRQSERSLPEAGLPLDVAGSLRTFGRSGSWSQLEFGRGRGEV